MSNTHDDIKKLLRASRNMLSTPDTIKEENNIRSRYNLINEQGIDLTQPDILTKADPAKSVEDSIEDSQDEKEQSSKDKKQGYRISGGILVLHGKNQTELELTTDEKIAFQETMDEFVSEVSDLTEFNKLNIYPNNVEWSGKIIDFDIEFYFSIGEENGVYIDSQMVKVDEKFLDLLTKLQKYYEKFKSKWSKVLASRKRTSL